MLAVVSPLRNPTACATLSGLLLVLSFPHAHLTFLAWVALAPLVASVCYRRTRRRLFLLGYWCGIIFFAGTCPWIYDVMRIYGHLSVAAAGGVLALFVLIMALYFGVFALTIGELARRWQFQALMAVPFVWVALEWARAHLIFGGFPWNLLGYAIAPHIGWIQYASYTGIYGVSFLVAAVNALVVAYWLAPSLRRMVSLAAVVLLLAVAELWSWRLPPEPAAAQAVLVQPNLPQQEDYDPDWVRHHPDELARLEQASRAAARSVPPGRQTLLVWPEVPVSFYFHHDPALRARLLQLAQATRSYFLVGIVDYRPDAEGKQRAYNSAALLSPAGEFIGQYDKIHLVPFGEYVPLEDWLSFLGPLVQEVSAFSPGPELAVLPAGEGKLAVIICYEAVFPALVRQFVDRGAEVLVNISNDGWYGVSAAPAQHLNMARMRAVETRRFLLRATNTGVTTIVDPYGRLVAQAPAHTEAVLVGSFAFRRQPSFYMRSGDWFPALCVLVALLLVVRRFWVLAVEGSEQPHD